MKFNVFFYSSSIPLRVRECSFPLKLLSAGFAGILRQQILREYLKREKKILTSSKGPYCKILFNV